MKKSLIFVGMLTIGYINAQYDGKVGINTESPSATLNVKTKTDATSPKNLELENQTGTKLVTVLNRNGNVGINTETPIDKLHVKDGAIRVEAGGNTGGYLNIINSSKPTGTQGVMSMWTLYNMTGSYGNSLQFWGYRDVAGAGANAVQNVLVLQDTGNIGIGLRDPQEKLDVNGKVRVRNLFANAGADTDKVVVVDNTGVLKTIARTDFANATSVTDATEWVYDDTTKQIKLKRSGTLFGNTVFYNKNGALLNYDLTSYKWFNVNNGTTPTETLDFANYLGNALYRKTSSINFGTSKNYDMNEEVLYVDSTTSADMNILGRSSSVYISPDNTKNYQVVRGIKGEAAHYGSGNAKYLHGGYFDARLERGYSDGYVYGLRATASYGTNQTSKQQTGVGVFNTIAKSAGGSIENMIDFDAYKNFANGSPLAVTNMKGFYAKNVFTDAVGKVSITSARGFDYDGLDLTNSTHSVENNYGLYVGNIAGGKNVNYSIYTNAGQVRFGDLAGTGNREVYVDENGVLKAKTTTMASNTTLWVEDVATNSIKLAVNSDGNTRTNAVSITDGGMVLGSSFRGTNGATIFPDYVFQKYYDGVSDIKADYTFKSLSQVEDFVKTNGHLPGYKSAAAIKAQGYVDLMETQLTNVEKIEELYLHSIEQDKTNKTQAQEIETLRKENEELKARLEKLEKLLK